ncbi:MAG: gamma-glutamyl-gamma-aminobutyrate hydrolase family protein [Nitrospirota bacterium]
MKPIIGITPDSKLEENNSPIYFLKKKYVSVIEDMGGIPVIIPFIESKSVILAVLDKIDGLLITGSGPDINPEYYNEKQIADFEIMSKDRIAFEISVIKMTGERGLPILGICGGMQIINVFYGGTLYQDINLQIEGVRLHKGDIPNKIPSHPVEIVEGTLLHNICKERRIEVNSSHHQSVKGSGHGLKVSAYSDDGIAEGIESIGSNFIIGVQWHPELLYETDIYSRRIFEAFLHSASSYSSNSNIGKS